MIISMLNLQCISALLFWEFPYETICIAYLTTVCVKKQQHCMSDKLLPSVSLLNTQSRVTGTTCGESTRCDDTCIEIVVILGSTNWTVPWNKPRSFDLQKTNEHFMFFLRWDASNETELNW